MPATRARPATVILVATLGLLAATAAQAAAAAAGTVISPSAIAAAATDAVPPELGMFFARPRLLASRDAKLRCERSFLDFVELMWPVLDPGQPFHRGRVQEAIALHLEAVTAGKIRNFLGNVPPGSTKTYLANVFWPAWEWGPKNRPDLRYMAWSYSPELALQAAEDCRKVIKSEVYQRYWGDRFELDSSSDAKGFYRNNKGGWRRASSVGGASTGFRADRLIFDDPHNVKDADSPASLLEATRWFSRSLPTRVRSPGGGHSEIRVPIWVRDVHGALLDDPDDDRPVVASATVGIMQRVHLHDIAGIILRNPALGYEILLIEMRYKGADHPARRLETWRASTIGYQDWRTEIGELADPVRYPEEEVARIEAQMIADGGGADAIAAQLDQWPIVDGGTMFKVDWLPIIEPDEVPAGVDKRGWDFAGSKAKKADQTATACVRRAIDKRFYLLDSSAMRGGPGAVDKFIRGRHATDPKALDWSIPRDPGATGIHFAEYVVRELAPGRYVTSSAELGKVQSAKPVSSQAQHGNFAIVRHPGCEVTRAQLIDFPYGQHDDLVDAISRAVAAHVHLPAQSENFGGESGDAGQAAASTESTQVDWAG